VGGGKEGRDKDTSRNEEDGRINTRKEGELARISEEDEIENISKVTFILLSGRKTNYKMVRRLDV
jgi:hypothetical protein